MTGFTFRYRLNGDQPTIRWFPRGSKGGELTGGDMLTLGSGKVSLGEGGAGDLLGVLLESANDTKARVITDGDAVYGVDDDNARIKGATLELTGGSGAQGVAEGSNGDLEVVIDCSAAEETLIRIKVGRHSQEEPLATAGRLNSAIANAVVRIQSQYVGRGPKRAQAFFRHNVVVILMEDTMTKGERSLVADGSAESVLHMRREFQRAMRDELVTAIEELTSRQVVAFMSDNHIGPDLAVELFVLDEPVSAEQSSAG
jgi:uncharacterized protein YbcI